MGTTYIAVLTKSNIPKVLLIKDGVCPTTGLGTAHQLSLGLDVAVKL